MSLLVDMSGAALDPSYAEAAAKRAAGGQRSGRVPRRMVALLALAGAATGVAAAQVRARADDVGASRRALVADIRQRTAATDLLATRAAALGEAVARTRAQMLGTDARGQRAAADVAALELVSGTVAVRGPGLVVTLDDASKPGEGTGDRGGQPGDGRVYDRDLQVVVNALWAAGAEAISINNQRLTALTAIRSAGEAVLVDLRPLSPPYVLRAVGDVDTLEPRFVDSPTARTFQTWTSLYGLGFEVRRGKDLRLPAASPPELRIARPGGNS